MAHAMLGKIEDVRMDLRQLYYFVAVAEKLHLAREQSRVHTAQPLLSTQIKSLAWEFSDHLPVHTTRRLRLTRVTLYELAQCALGFRPDRSASGGGAVESISAKKAETSTSSTAAKASRAPTVTFSDPRSTRPTYDRSISASSARRSCDSPRPTRSLRRFQPILCRTSMPTEGHIRCLTIDGLSVPY